MLKIYTQSDPTAIAFIDEVRQRLSMAIQRIQKHHGNEFGTDFTWRLRDLGIAHRHIPAGCPESNGKVERSHRTDAEEFYRRKSFRAVAELEVRLRRWEQEYNHLSRWPGSAYASSRVLRVLCTQWPDYVEAQPHGQCAAGAKVTMSIATCMPSS